MKMGSGGSKRKSNSESSSSKEQGKRKNSKSELKDNAKSERGEDANSAAATTGGRSDEVAIQEAIDGKNGTATHVNLEEDGGKSQTTTAEVTLRTPKTANSAARRTSFYDTVDAAEILPYLVMGNLASARNPGFLKGKHVGFILNLTTEGEAAGRRADNREMGIEQLQVEIEDDEDEDISGHFDVCFEFIRRAKVTQASTDDKKKHVPAKRVLVHSNYGLSRTSAIVLAYLMKEKQWTIREANEHLKKCHSSAKPNDGFLVQLLRYEQELHGKMSMTLKDFYQQP